MGVGDSVIGVKRLAENGYGKKKRFRARERRVGENPRKFHKVNISSRLKCLTRAPKWGKNSVIGVKCLAEHEYKNKWALANGRCGGEPSECSETVSFDLFAHVSICLSCMQFSVRTVGKRY